MAEESTFRLPLRCANCSHTWEIGVPLKSKVDSGYGGVWIHPHDCLNHPCTGWRPGCPNCGRKEEVRRG